MNFQTLPAIVSSASYLDMAFSQAKREARHYSSSTKEHFVTRIEIVRDCLLGQFRDVIDKYPSFDNLPPFYNDLSDITLDKPSIHQALSSFSWFQKKLKELTKIYLGRVKKSRSTITMDKNTSAYYGRIVSLLKRMDKHIETLQKARRIMKDYPDIKDMYTVCILGFPNVGKSTLLSKITPAKPKIENYAFTTKTLNSGFLTYEYHKIQIIDTPGTLARPEKMNSIEKQAYLALKHVANLIIFVYDPTDDHDKQMQLYSKVKREAKVEILIYLSKTDKTDERPKEFSSYSTTPSQIQDIILEKYMKKLAKTPYTLPFKK